MTNFANLTAILALADQAKVEYVDIKKVGRIGVKSLSIEEKEAYEEALPKKEDAGFMTIRGPLVKACAVDENGNEFFKDVSLEQVRKLPSWLIEPLFRKALDVNGMRENAVEEAEKN